MSPPTPPALAEPLTDAEIAELRAMFSSQRRGILVMPDEAERVVRLCDALLNSEADRRHLAGLLGRGVQFVEQDGAELERLRERLKLAEQDRNDAQERLHRETERHIAALTAAEALAYLGDHHFPSLTHKARLEELVPKHRELGRALTAAEAERLLLARALCWYAVPGSGGINGSDARDAVDVARDIVASGAADTFEQAWERMRARGYQYGPEALEQVRFGWELARGEAEAAGRSGAEGGNNG